VPSRSLSLYHDPHILKCNAMQRQCAASYLPCSVACIPTCAHQLRTRTVAILPVYSFTPCKSREINYITSRGQLHCRAALALQPRAPYNLHVEHGKNSARIPSQHISKNAAVTDARYKVSREPCHTVLHAL
jgi:hypothetical protein